VLTWHGRRSDFAQASDYSGVTLDNKTFGNFLLKGITPPVFYYAPAPNVTQISASNAINLVQQIPTVSVLALSAALIISIFKLSL
jgi:hypothetical protein